MKRRELEREREQGKEKGKQSGLLTMTRARVISASGKK